MKLKKRGGRYVIFNDKYLDIISASIMLALYV